MFVKTPRGMVLTPLAESVAGPIRDVLARIEHEVFERGSFRPENLTRTFKIRTTDFAEALFAPSLLEVIAKQTPNVRFSVQPVGVTLPKSELETGMCDLAIAGFFTEIPEGFHREPLFADTFMCAVKTGHPRLRGRRTKITLDQFCAENHLLVAPSGELTGAVDSALARQKRKRTVTAGTSGFFIAAWMTAQSDCIVTAPSRLLAMLAKRLELSTFPPPIPLPEIRVAAVWHARTHADPAHRWFRNLVRDQLR